MITHAIVSRLLAEALETREASWHVRIVVGFCPAMYTVAVIGLTPMGAEAVQRGGAVLAQLTR